LKRAFCRVPSGRINPSKNARSLGRNVHLSSAKIFAERPKMAAKTAFRGQRANGF
jgi:hypothetical protein